MITSLKIPIKRFLIVGFSLVLALVLAVQYFSTNSINALMEQENQLLNASEVIIHIESLKSNILNFESKIRGFVLTGNDLFLDKNEINQQRSIEELKHLQEASLTPEENTYRLTVEKLVNEKIEFNQNILILYNKQNPKEAIDLINTGKGKQMTDSINQALDKIVFSEKQKIEQRVVQNELYIKKVKMADLIGIVLFVGVLLFSFIIIFDDLTKRSRLEKELRSANKKVEHSALIKEQFMANMSHEIRTPMNAVLGYTHRLNKTTLNPEQKEYVHSLNTAGENLLSIINDILDFSKIEEGMLRIDEVDVNIQGLMHSVTTMLQIKAREKNISLVLNPLENIPEHLTGDPTRLTQILVNLISNSIKFTQEGSIEVTAKLSKESDSDVKVQFSVKDTGIGIPTEKLNAVFERFNQGNADTTRKYGGTGLGLSIVKKLVELMKGSITVSSEVKKGTTFTFILPFKKSTEAKFNPGILHPDTQSYHPLHLNILVTEDNKFNQNLLVLLLQEWGITYDLATNGVDAIELLKQTHYDLILMDIQMPLMNGYEATQHIREELKNDVPIVAMTAHAFVGEREKCLSLGMTDYISKPIREKVLFDILKKYDTTTPSTEKTDQVVDLTYLQDLSFGKEAFVTDMIALFLQDVPVEIEKLDTAIQQKEFETIQRVSHKLKSTIPFVGIDKLIEADLSEMESLAEQKTGIEKIQELFRNVDAICQKAISELM